MVKIMYPAMTCTTRQELQLRGVSPKKTIVEQCRETDDFDKRIAEHLFQKGT